MKYIHAGSRPFRIKLFLSYAIFFILPLLVMGIIAFQWLSAITLEQTVGVYQNSLSSAREYSDKQFSELKKLSLQLSQTGWVKKYMVRDFSVYQEEQLDLRRYNEELLIYNVANDFIDDIAIYFHNRAKVLSSLGVNDFEYFFTDNFDVRDFDLAKWESILDQNNQAALVYNAQISTYGLIRSGIIYIQSYPMDLKSDFRATLLMFINKNTISKVVSSLFHGEDTQVYILNEHHGLIGGSYTEIETAEKIKSMIFQNVANDDILQTQINGETNLVFIEPSITTDWVYAAVIPRASVMKEVRKIQTIIVLLVIVSSISGLLVSYVLANHSYKPVDGILKVLGAKKVPYKNEFDLIKNEIIGLVNHDKKLKERMEYDKPTLIDAYFSKLLSKTENDKAEIINILDWFGIHLTSPLHCCLIISWHDKEPDSIILNDLTGMGKDENLIVHFAGNGQDTAIICGYSQPEQFNKYIEDLFIYLKASGVYISIGAGTGYKDVKELCNSYSEAQEALDYHLIKDEKCSIIYYETINRHWYYYYPADKEAFLMQSLRSGSYESAVLVFDQLLDQNMQGDHINMVIVRYFFFYSLMSAYALCNELDIEGVYKDGGEILSKCQDISEMKRYIMELYYMICEHVRLEKKSHNTKLKDDIYEYIEANVFDESMTLSKTADEFGISSSYLSRFFKEQYGCNFLDYIHRKRIGIAKNLLANCDRPIGDIMVTVGYNNTVTFRRLFRKYEGLSPGQYRNKVCQEK